MYKKNTKSQHLTVKMHSFSDIQNNRLKKFDIKDTEGWTYNKLESGLQRRLITAQINTTPTEWLFNPPHV